MEGLEGPSRELGVPGTVVHPAWTNDHGRGRLRVRQGDSRPGPRRGGQADGGFSSRRAGGVSVSGGALLRPRLLLASLDAYGSSKPRELTLLSPASSPQGGLGVGGGVEDPQDPVGSGHFQNPV